MTRHVGRISLLLAVTSWLVFIASLLVGGIDPAPLLAKKLRHVGMGSLLLVPFSMLLAIIALARGPQRAAAAVGLALGLLYLAVFTGLIWALFFWL
jgi:hypothetical protein